jgi:DNA-binding PadR family transcriptional regulator
MFDIIKSSPLSPEDLNKINTWRQEIKNGGVENIDNPTKEVVEEHSQIYNSLTEDEKQKWVECEEQAKKEYYAMMTDLGYENVEKRFTFFKAYLANSDSRDFRLNKVAFFTNDKNSLCTKYSTSLLSRDSEIIVQIMVHENIHANDNNKRLDDNNSKSGLNILYKEKKATTNREVLTRIVEKIKADWKTLDEAEQEFIQTILDKDLDKLASYFSWFTDRELFLNNFNLIFSHSFLEEERLEITTLDNKELRDKIVILFSNLKYLNPSFTLDGTSFNEGVTEYFASKYTSNFEYMSYRDYVEKIKSFIDKLDLITKKGG